MSFQILILLFWIWNGRNARFVKQETDNLNLFRKLNIYREGCTLWNRTVWSLKLEMHIWIQFPNHFFTKGINGWIDNLTLFMTDLCQYRLKTTNHSRNRTILINKISILIMGNKTPKILQGCKITQIFQGSSRAFRR